MTATAYFLASKVEEHQRSLNTVIAATLNRGRAMRDKDNRIRGFDPQAPQVVDFRNKVLHCEETMLRTLCFDLTVRLPYPAMMNGVKRMWKGEEQEFITKVSRAAWHFISDRCAPSLRDLRDPTPKLTHLPPSPFAAFPASSYSCTDPTSSPLHLSFAPPSSSRSLCQLRRRPATPTPRSRTGWSCSM